MKITCEIFYQKFSIKILVGILLCFDAFETFKLLIFLRTSTYCTEVTENYFSGSILLFIMTILG